MINEFIVIDVMNEAMIRTLSQKKENCEENLKIRQYLADEAFFFKKKKKKALQILRNVGIKEENISNVYNKLISQSMYYELLNNGKINNNDSDLIIKYENIKSGEELFKKKK